MSPVSFDLAARRGARSPSDRARRDPAGTKIPVALDIFYGPIHHRVLHGRAPLDDRFIRDVIHTALGGKRSSLSAPLTWLI
jgi:hypothetical protein